MMSKPSLLALVKMTVKTVINLLQSLMDFIEREIQDEKN